MEDINPGIKGSFCTFKKLAKTNVLLLLSLPGIAANSQPVTKIDRKALVTRHNITITDKNLEGPGQVGNGHFAFGFDITGLQTFSKGANTMSDWGWHKFPTPNGQTPADYKGQEWDTQGRMVRYDLPNPDQKDLAKWMIANPQRINLGRFGFILQKKDGSIAVLEDLKNPLQKLDLWTGIATSSFEVDGKTVKVTTISHPGQDAIALHVEAPDLNDGQIGFFLEFPYASHNEFGNGADWSNPDKHQTQADLKSNSAVFHRTMDDFKFDVNLKWANGATIKNIKPHRYELMPTGENHVDVVLSFSKTPVKAALPSFAQTRLASEISWPKFWNSGGAIDLSGSKDPRWMELERRIVLSQYIMAVNEAGST
ncbi:MAG: hypothetical protein ABI113_03500, partial [Mucilaginibacter sp.]